MRIEPISPNPISFGYNSPLKTLYRKGQLPSVRYGFMEINSLKRMCL
jgi:hypothetical protein